MKLAALERIAELSREQHPERFDDVARSVHDLARGLLACSCPAPYGRPDALGRKRPHLSRCAQSETTKRLA